MAGWLDRLRRSTSGPAGTGLAAHLRDYPPYAAPHAGPPTRWTLEQAHENLAYLLQHRDQRLQVLGELLAAEGIEVGRARDDGDWLPLVDALHHWANARWPALHEPDIVTEATWLRSTRCDGEIAFSMLMDVALLLGELIIRRHPGYRWDLDLDEVNGRDGMRSYLRPVLLLPAHGAMPSAVVLDLEDIVVSRYLHPEYKANKLLNTWAQVVEDAVSGRYEAAWSAPARSS
ncbi:hypothetical protein [Piscinibacter sp.]|uniref:hypothetical protein n=1 Tax=Piscinibacter sp. TaxID=1903157 RepID=UPI002BC7F4E1|nr:hypothetical protein [Albitalea sp.]HUG23537.1 hypothetical protein [Albitalea sp.]